MDETLGNGKVLKTSHINNSENYIKQLVKLCSKDVPEGWDLAR